MPTRSLQCQRSLIVAGDGVATRRRVTCLITLNYPRLLCLRCLHCLRLLVGPFYGACTTSLKKILTSRRSQCVIVEKIATR